MSIPLAVLIDAENISPALFPDVKRGIAKLGDAIVWQLHGDLIGTSTKGWHEVAKAENLDVRHQPQAGKNCADIAITIAAMDLLREGVVRGICLVSSDSDFVPLARRLRAGNMLVHGFGGTKTREAFKAACTTFVVLAAKSVPVPAQLAKAAPATPPATPSPAPKTHTPVVVPAVPKAPSSPLKPADIRRLRDILIAAASDGSSVHAGKAATAVMDRAPDLAPMLLGKGKFITLLLNSGLVVRRLGTDSQALVVQPQPLKIVPG